MRTFLASSTVFLTILFSLAFGIACGYAVIAFILRALVQKSEPAAAAAGRPVVAASTSVR